MTKTSDILAEIPARLLMTDGEIEECPGDDKVLITPAIFNSFAGFSDSVALDIVELFILKQSFILNQIYEDCIIHDNIEDL